MPVRAGQPVSQPAAAPDPAPTPVRAEQSEVVNTSTGEVTAQVEVVHQSPPPAASSAEDLAGVSPTPENPGSKAVSTEVWNPPVLGIVTGAASAIEKMLPRGMDMAAWMEVAKAAMRRNPKEIAKCTPESIINALIDCARDGLTPDGNDAFLVARKDRKTGTFRLSYQPTVPGYSKRLKALKQIEDVNCQPVYENDEFEADFVSGEITHRFKGWARGKWMGTFCQFIFPDGRKDIELMSVAEILKVEEMAGVSSAWKNYKPEMSRKTVFYRLRKRHPLQDPRLDATFRREEDLYGLNEGEKQKVLPAGAPATEKLKKALQPGRVTATPATAQQTDALEQQLGGQQ